MWSASFRRHKDLQNYRTGNRIWKRTTRQPENKRTRWTDVLLPAAENTRGKTAREYGIAEGWACQNQKEIAMSTLQRISITALAALALGAATAFAGQLPQYEVTGFPISPLQMSVVRPGVIQEEPQAPALTLDGMPASPHQITVIRGHQLAHKLKTDASDRS
jgi:hypothetical protein